VTRSAMRRHVMAVSWMHGGVRHSTRALPRKKSTCCPCHRAQPRRRAADTPVYDLLGPGVDGPCYPRRRAPRRGVRGGFRASWRRCTSAVACWRSSSVERQKSRPPEIVLTVTGMFSSAATRRMHLFQTWPRLTLLVMSRWSASNVLGVRVASSMDSSSWAFERCLSAHSSARV
jgi:hypothetical protein